MKFTTRNPSSITIPIRKSQEETRKSPPEMARKLRDSMEEVFKKHSRNKKLIPPQSDMLVETIRIRNKILGIKTNNTNTKGTQIRTNYLSRTATSIVNPSLKVKFSTNSPTQDRCHQIKTLKTIKEYFPSKVIPNQNHNGEGNLNSMDPRPTKKPEPITPMEKRKNKLYQPKINWNTECKPQPIHKIEENEIGNEVVVRIMTLNVRAVYCEEQFRFNEIMKVCSKQDIDIALLTEHNLNFYHDQVKENIRRVIKRFWVQHIMITSQTNDTSHSSYQPGGTMIIVSPKLHHRIGKRGRDKKGRWCWIIIRGKNKTRTLVICAYGIAQKGVTYGPFTYTAQLQKVRDDDMPGLTVREVFWKDLTKFIQSQQ